MKKFISLLVLTAVLVACGQKDKKAQLEELKKSQASIATQIKDLEAEIAASDTSKKSEKVKDVLLTALVAGPFKHYIDVQGMVDADENVAVQPQMAGVITRINVNEGDVVRVGQILAELDNAPYQAQLNTLQPQLTLATDVFNRQKRLWDQKIGSELQFLQAKTSKESLEKQIALAQEQIELTRIKSPINGTVDHISAKVGQFASPQNPDPAFRVVNLSNLKVKAEVAEAYGQRVVKGGKVKLFFPDINQEIDGQLSYAARFISPLTRTFTAEAIITGATNQYHPNMVAVMKIIDYSSENALVIPINVIQSSGTEQYVYVASPEGNKTVARKKIVEVGTTYNGNAEIKSGLAENDRVITTGYLDVTDGMEIKF